MIIGTRYSEYYLEYYLLFGILLEYYKKCYSFNPADILLLGWLHLYWPHMAARLSTTLLPCGRAHMVETVSHILHSLYYPITTVLH